MQHLSALSPADSVPSDLKYLGHVLSRDFQRHREHIEAISAQHLASGKGDNSHSFLDFNYAVPSVEIKLKSIAKWGHARTTQEEFNYQKIDI